MLKAYNNSKVNLGHTNQLPTTLSLPNLAGDMPQEAHGTWSHHRSFSRKCHQFGVRFFDLGVRFHCCLCPKDLDVT